MEATSAPDVSVISPQYGPSSVPKGQEAAQSSGGVMLIVVSDSALRGVETEIVSAARNAASLRGDHVALPTIDPHLLRQAAILAVSIASGHTVWDGSETLRIPAPRRITGVVEHET